LWFKLAEANGLTGASALSEGQMLTIPAGVAKNTHNASTFKPYDAAEAIGDTSPTAPRPGSKNKCGAFGAVLLVIVAVAVTAIVAPWRPGLSPARPLPAPPLLPVRRSPAEQSAAWRAASPVRGSALRPASRTSSASSRSRWQGSAPGWAGALAGSPAAGSSAARSAAWRATR